MRSTGLSAMDDVEARLRETHARAEAQMAEVVRLQRDGADDTQALSLLQEIQGSLSRLISRAKHLLRTERLVPKPSSTVAGDAVYQCDRGLLIRLRQSVTELRVTQEQTKQILRESIELLELARQMDRPLLDPENGGDAARKRVPGRVS